MRSALRPVEDAIAPRWKVMLTADAVGGVWTYALDLAAGLRALGIVTTLAVLGPDPSQAQLTEAARLSGLDVVVTGLPLDWLARDEHEITESARALAALAAIRNVDLVHLSSPALAAGAKFPVPVVATCHSCMATWWSAVRGPDAPMPDDFRRRTERMREGLYAADSVVAPSRAFAEALRLTYALERPVEIVHNGSSAVGAPVMRQQVRETPQVFAFTAGRLWDEGKNVAALDSAAQRLRFPVLAAGPLQGPNGACIALRHVEPLGVLPASRVASFVARRPIFVSTALYEPFGLAVLEAAAAGAPLVLSDIPTFRELWSGAAVFVPPRDPEAIARTLDELAYDAGLRHALGRAAQRRAETFNVPAVAHAMARIYQSVMIAHSRRGAAFAAVG
jgi:glycogen synthase